VFQFRCRSVPRRRRDGGTASWPVLARLSKRTARADARQSVYGRPVRARPGPLLESWRPGPWGPGPLLTRPDGRRGSARPITGCGSHDDGYSVTR
jgi:hypothetical protein